MTDPGPLLPRFGTSGSLLDLITFIQAIKDGMLRTKGRQRDAERAGV